MQPITRHHPLNQRGEPPATDQELITRVLRQEESALCALHNRYRRLVAGIARRIIRDHGLIAEVVQDIFQAVWQNAGNFQADGCFVAWLIGIARHRAIDATRTRLYNARAREESLADWRIAGVIGVSDGLENTLLHRTVVHAALGTLPLAQRQAIVLHDIYRLSAAEIAAELGWPLGTVHTRLRLGRAKLRTQLRQVLEPGNEMVEENDAISL